MTQRTKEIPLKFDLKTIVYIKLKIVALEMPFTWWRSVEAGQIGYGNGIKIWIVSITRQKFISDVTGNIIECFDKSLWTPKLSFFLGFPVKNSSNYLQFLIFQDL